MGAAAAVAATVLALVAQDNSALRASPSAQASVQATLTAGDLVEVRAHTRGHAQVWDHRRERGGYVRSSALRPLAGPAEPAALLAVLRFLRDTPGAESLGIAYVAAYLKAAPAGQITAEPFEALGHMAERLAQRASQRGGVAPALEAVAAYGVRFRSVEQQGSVTLCYDGDAWQRVLAVPASPAQRAQATLALTRHDCVDAGLPAQERLALDRARAALLERITPADTAALDGPTRNQLRLRQAGVWAALAFADGRRGADAAPAAQRALDALAAVDKAELGDDEQAPWHDAALRVGAVRQAALAAALPPGFSIQPGEPGQTCLRWQAAGAPPLQRCTWGVVWPGSVRPSPDGRALAITVQPLEGWAELWVLRSTEQGWAFDALPPAAAAPGLGYVEWAGWAAGPRPRLLLVREARIGSMPSRRFEVLDARTLELDKSASQPQLLAAFGQAAAPAWRRGTLALR